MESASTSLTVPSTTVQRAISTLVVGFFHASDEGDNLACLLCVHTCHEDRLRFQELLLTLHFPQDVGCEDEGFLRVAWSLADIPKELGLQVQEALSPSAFGEVP